MFSSVAAQLFANNTIPAESMINRNVCRCCGTVLHETFAQLGMTPMANAFVRPEAAMSAEPFYPLHAFVCSDCHLVQLGVFENPTAIFGDYLYFSSFSQSWLKHTETYAARMTARFDLGPHSQVVEVASNDGYLLQYFVARGIPVLGVDPAANVAEAARVRNVPTDVAFFGTGTAQRLRASGVAPTLMVANNVLAHVPDLHDFVEGFHILLTPGGVATFEFPHLLQMIRHNQFDTIHHEHFSYLSLQVVERVFAVHGLAVFDVEELPTHGGSLRVFVRHAADAAALPVQPAVALVQRAEADAILCDSATYQRFAQNVIETKCALLDFLIGARRRGEKVAAYGAPAKGNTLLNYCGVGPEVVSFTVDSNPHKQELLLPSTRIPIYAPSAIAAARPDYVLILPWNLRDEIANALIGIREWGGRFVVPIPKLEVF